MSNLPEPITIECGCVISADEHERTLGIKLSPCEPNCGRGHGAIMVLVVGIQEDGGGLPDGVMTAEEWEASKTPN